MTIWDILLLICVPAMGCCAAYLPNPRHKALVISLPIPFSIATVALGEPVNATHVCGLLVLLGFWYAVYGIRRKWRVPIIVTIAAAAAAYCVVAAALSRAIPRGGAAFWLAEAVVLLLGAVLYVRVGEVREPEYRSPLPIWLKAPVLGLVILLLLALKSRLSGFMTVFPMVGVLTAYEARHSLWTVSRQVPILMLSMAPMMAVVRAVAPQHGIGIALAAGWFVLAVIQVVLLRHRRAMDRQRGGSAGVGAAAVGEG